jgi:hypothetical protein
LANPRQTDTIKTASTRQNDDGPALGNRALGDVSSPRRKETLKIVNQFTQAKGRRTQN